MRIIRDLTSCPSAYQGAVIALGNFDGVHLGHQAIVREAVLRAKEKNVPAAVMTFEPHPREFFSGKERNLRIASLRTKLRCFADMGVEAVFLVRFNAVFAALTPEAFVSDILGRALAVSHIVTGYNFAFGKGRAGDTTFLAEQAKARGYGYTACPAVMDEHNVPVSSSAIRELLAAGDMKKAAQWLGRPYGIDGRVRQGRKQGRLLGFPTANIALGKRMPPRYGVYAARFKVGDAWYDGVVNLGVRPSFGASEPLLEVHGFGLETNLYGQYIQVEFIDFIRDERRFEALDALKEQIAHDCVQAKKMLAKEALAKEELNIHA